MSEAQRIIHNISAYTYDVAAVLQIAPEGTQQAIKASFVTIMHGYCDALTQAVEEEYTRGTCFQENYSKSA